MAYPDAPRSGQIDVLHGRAVADPYRWLEDESSDATRAWLDAQVALLGKEKAQWAGRAELSRLLRNLTPGLISSPQVRGGRQFFERREPGQEHAVYWVRGADGSERALIDPAVIDPSLATVLDGAAPSMEGDRVAYLLSGGGREESSLHVMDVESGTALEEPTLLGRGGTIAWKAGGKEIFCVRRLPDHLLPEGEDQFHRRVWRHVVGTDPIADDLLFGEGRDKTTYFGLQASLDGRWLVVSASLGTAPRNDVYLLDTVSERWLTVQEGEDVETHAFIHADGRLYLLTNRDAPRWRLCVAEPRDPAPAGWSELLGETEGVLSDVAVTSDAVAAVYTRDVVSQVEIHDRISGALIEHVALPGLGVADVSTRPEGGAELWIGYTDYLRPRVVLHHRIGEHGTEVWGETPGAVGLDATAEQLFVASPDGTAVPAFVVAGRAGPGGGPRPTILYGYGGFNVPLPPAYSALFAAWVAAGGVIAVANLRGGGEYGERWHREGMRENKQNVFDDFLAVAEHLIGRGTTDAGHLGIFGGSNGGLLVGAALTQRPELFRAVVCSAPLLDMVRYELFGLGQTWNDEYGTAEDPVELGWLLSYSPYHHVRDGVAYPAVLFTVFDGDTRVDPLHARKMCAALQHATASPMDHPVLFRRESDVGHGARAVSRSIELQADELGFMASQLGLR